MTQPPHQLYRIPGFPGYVVTNMGVVYSLKQHQSPRRVRIYETSLGALYVRLVGENGRRRSIRIRKILYQQGLELDDEMKELLREHEKGRKGHERRQTPRAIGNSG
jgi:hypothetical protein